MLDIRTIAITFFINSFVATLFMAALWQQNRKQFPGISLWLTSFAMLTAAFVLVSLRNVIPDAVSILIANTCVAAAVFILYLGLERFVACPSSQRHNYIILAVFMGLFTYFTFFKPDVAIRIALLNTTLNLMFLQSSWLMLHRVGSQLKPLSRATGIVCLIFAVAGCYRIILVFLMPTPSDYLNVNLWDAIGLLINQILTIGLVLVMILMVNRRMLLNILNQEEILVRSKVELEISNRDLTQHKSIEAALRESEAKYRLIVENSRDIIFVLNPEGEFIYLSPSISSILGYSQDELTGRTFRSLIHPDDLPIIQKVMRLNIENGQQTPGTEYRVRHASGEWRWHTAKGNAVRDMDGEFLNFTGIANDITERRQTEEALKVSEAQYRLLADNTVDGIWLLDMNLKLIYCSPASEKQSGFTLQEIMDMSLEQYFTPESLKVVAEAFLEAMPKVEADPDYNPVLTLDLEFYKKDGTAFWAESKFSIIRDMHSKPVSILGHARDISERKRAEEALRESEARFRRLSENAPDVIYRYRLKPVPRFEYVSPASIQISGYTPEEYYADPLLARKLVHPEDRNQHEQHFRSLKSSGTPLTLRWIHKDGHVIWTEEIDVPILGVNGELVAYEGIARDITKRKRAEEALRESEAQYRLLSEHTTDIIWLVNGDLKTTYVSPNVQNLRGFTPSEIMEMPLEKHLTPESLKFALELFFTELPRVDADTGYYPVHILELEYYRRDGSTFWAETKFSIIRDENSKPVSILGEARDITERKQIESALRESEEKYRLVVENAQEAIVIVMDGMVKFANRRTAELTGYTLEELTSRHYIEFIYPDDRQMVAERYLQRLKGMDIPGKYSFRCVHKSGDIKWAEVSVALIDWDGRPAILNFMTDTTDRKRLEEERQRVEKLQSVGLLAGGIAHDFNNILTAILGNISLARMDAAPGSGIYDSLEQAEKASLRAKELTQQLLTFSKGGAPIKKLAPISDLLRDTVSFALRGSNVKYHLSISSDLWHAEIDQGQVSQIIHNLVLNAQQAMPAGGTIDLAAENIALSKTQSLGRGLPLKEGNYIRIGVTDHGSGIPVEYVDRIFDPFFTTKHTGSGLGLATSFSIARNHGGYLSVESEPGLGSTFYLYLPASAETSTPRQDKKEEIKPVGMGKILVMDDEEWIRKIAGRLLRHIGYADIEFAVDGAEAVKLYSSAMESGQPFNVVILDLTIPGGMGGEAAIKKLLNIDPGVRAIVSSGYADEAVMANYKKYGFSGMVAKPYTLEELGKAVQDLMD